MVAWLRGALLGNWRNKGVALFFAAIIWFVAYQSELQNEELSVRVKLLPKQPTRVLVLAEERRRGGEVLPFSGVVSVRINGSRRQLDEFRQMLPARVEVLVDAAGEGDAERRTYFFNADDMTLPRTPVEIVQFEPASVDLVFDDRVEQQKPVNPVYPVREGWEKVVEKVDPPAVRVSGPRSILEKVRLVAEPSALVRERFDGTVPIQVRHESAEGVQVRNVVSFLDRSSVNLTLQLQVRQREYSAESVKVRFLVPPLRFPFKVAFEDAIVPVRFRGPEREIQRLEARIAEDPTFFVAVEVPAYNLTPEQVYNFTFTEDKLLLFGFSKEVQLLQHPSREGRGPWQCSLVPVKTE